jgi:endonuclease III-like uncharacterized protein
MGVSAVLVVPIVLVFLYKRLANLKHTQESKVEALKQAEQFETKDLEKRSTFYKDKLTVLEFTHQIMSIIKSPTI